jgi:hypothetical protein
VTNKQAVRKAAWDLVQREMLDNGVYELCMYPGTTVSTPYARVVLLDGRVEVSQSAYEAFTSARAR